MDSNKPVGLVCEDDDLVRSMFTGALEDMGLHVLESSSAEEGQLTFEKHGEIDLLLTDIRLAGELTGLDLAHWTSRHHPETRIMLVSGFPEAVMGSSQPNQYMFLSKPINITQLQEVAGELLGLQ